MLDNKRATILSQLHLVAQTGFCPVQLFGDQSTTWVSWNTHTEKFCAVWLAKGVRRPIFKVLVMGWNSNIQSFPKQRAFKTCDPIPAKVHTLSLMNWEVSMQIKIHRSMVTNSHRAKEPPHPSLKAQVKKRQYRQGKSLLRTSSQGGRDKAMKALNVALKQWWFLPRKKNARHQLHTGGDSAHDRATKSLIKLRGPFFGKAALKRERVESESEG